MERAPTHDQPVPPTEPAWAVFERLPCRVAIDALARPAQQAVYTPWVVLWLLVYQRLHANASLGDAVAHFRTHFAPPADPPASSTGAYRQARIRLPGAVVNTAARQVFEALVAGHPPSWRGTRVFLIDGTTVRLPPTEPLRGAFARTSNQYGRSHWPVRHLVAAHELASATAGGHRVLVRLTKARFRALVRKGRPAGDGRWSLTGPPTAADRNGSPGLGADASVTGWLHQVVVRADLTLWLFATVDGTGAELGHLYRRRQDVGTDVRDVKRTLGVDQMRGRTVPMVGKELSASLVAYNLATQVRRGPPGGARRISFAGVWSLVRAMDPVLRPGLPEGHLGRWFEGLVRAAGQRVLPNRPPGRQYPRELIPRSRGYPERKRNKKQTS